MFPQEIFKTLIISRFHANQRAELLQNYPGNCDLTGFKCSTVKTEKHILLIFKHLFTRNAIGRLKK